MKQVNFLISILLIFTWVNLNIAQSQKINIYGFFDFETEVSNKDAESKNWTFDQHHLNILANYILNNQFYIATEIDWEHGPSYSTNDISGNIYLAKAFLEYKYSNVFALRIGKFLSPFGIYNERHDATPTFLFTFLPQSVYGKKELTFGVTGRLFAKHSTGIQMLGNLYIGNWGIRYQIYLNNGRGPNEASKDNNSNKGVGWRLLTTLPGGNLRLGTSFYSDRNGNAFNARHTAIGFDVEYDYSNFHIESEYFIPKLENVNSSGIPISTFRNVTGYYVLGAYTLFNKLTPFARYEIFDPDVNISENEKNILTMGLNLAIRSNIYVKTEVYLHSFKDKSMENYELFVTSIAVAF